MKFTPFLEETLKSALVTTSKWHFTKPALEKDGRH
jgi:hypothetical protein